MRQSPAFEQVPAELWLPASTKLVGPDFLLAVDGFRAAPDGLQVDLHARGSGAGQSEDLAGVGGPGQPGPSVWVEVDETIVLSNIVTGQGGYYNGLNVRAEYDLWFPFDIGSVRSLSIDVVATWTRQTDETLRVRLPLEDVAAAARRSVRLPSI